MALDAEDHSVLESLDITILFQPADDYEPLLSRKEIATYELEILRDVRRALRKMRKASMLPMMYSVEKAVMVREGREP